MCSYSGKGLKMFMERRLSSSMEGPPALPKGRPDYAPLELLSGVALEQLRKSASNSASCPASARPPLLIPREVPFGKESSLSPVTLSPPSNASFGSKYVVGDRESTREDISADAERNQDPGFLRDQDSDVQRETYGRHRQGRTALGSNLPRLDVSPVIKRREREESKNDNNRSRGLSSRFCHICSRTTRKVKNVCCANFEKGTCRKVICEKCFRHHGWDWDAVVNNPAEWVCTHCQGCCPPKAQCAIYKRTNERRRESQQKLRHPVAFRPSSSDSDGMGSENNHNYLPSTGLNNGSQLPGVYYHHGIYEGPSVSSRDQFRMM